MRNRKRRNIIIWSVIIVIVLIAGIFSFVHPKSGKQNKTVTVGITTGNGDNIVWKSVAKTAEQKYGINIKLDTFTDYNQPNKALKSGNIDLNAFQHYDFLDNWNKANHGGVVAIGRTYIAPIRLYSKKYHKLSQLPKGATIAVPNDPTNESRALFVLKNAHLIGLRKNKSLVTVADITKNPDHLKIKEVATAQTGRVLNSVDAAVINNNYVPSGVGEKQTIFVEPINKDSEKWVNIICARTSQKHNKIYHEVVKAYQTNKTARLYKKLYGNKQLSAWNRNFNK